MRVFPRARGLAAAAAGAAGAQAHELGAMLDVHEAVAGGHGRGPVVEPAVAYLLHPAAAAAREVVMVAAAADQERLLAALAPERVRLALVGEALEVAVDGGEADTLEPPVQLLGRDRAIGAAKRVEDRLSLFGSPAHEG